MSLDSLKDRILDLLAAGPIPADGDYGPAVHLLKRDGRPIVTEKGAAGALVHRLLDLRLPPEDVRQKRSAGLTQALRWHRRELPQRWAELIASIACPLARDEAADYLRGIARRAKTLARY